MDVTVTVERRSSGARADVRLDLGDGKPAGPVLDELRRLVGGTPGEAVAAGHRLLDPVGAVRNWELCDGQVVTVGHQPDCSSIVFALTGQEVEFKTGAFFEVEL